MERNRPPASIFLSTLLILTCQAPGALALAGEASPQPVLARYCSHCHAPPSPRLHRAGDWARIVARMDRHRLDAGLRPLAPSARREILHYLRKHALP